MSDILFISKLKRFTLINVQRYLDDFGLTPAYQWWYLVINMISQPIIHHLEMHIHDAKLIYCCSHFSISYHHLSEPSQRWIEWKGSSLYKGLNSQNIVFNKKEKLTKFSIFERTWLIEYSWKSSQFVYKFLIDIILFSSLLTLEIHENKNKEKAKGQLYCPE